MMHSLRADERGNQVVFDQATSDAGMPLAEIRTGRVIYNNQAPVSERFDGMTGVWRHDGNEARASQSQIFHQSSLLTRPQ
jgi:hypothetical protein